MNQPLQLPPPPWQQLPNPTQVLSIAVYILLLPLFVLRGFYNQQASLPSSLPSFPSSPSFSGASFTNEESWVIQRGSEGEITGVVIHRNAREGQW